MRLYVAMEMVEVVTRLASDPAVTNCLMRVVAILRVSIALS